jgi:hypothetical protein
MVKPKSAGELIASLKEEREEVFGRYERLSSFLRNLNVEKGEGIVYGDGLMLMQSNILELYLWVLDARIKLAARSLN